MTPLTKEQEEQAKEACREIFYAAKRAEIQTANSAQMANMIDLVRGDHRLLDVLYGWLTPNIENPLIYPLRTYELIRELKEKSDGNPDRRVVEAEARP